MGIDKVRYYLTKHTEKYFFTCENLYLLIHPSVKFDSLINKINDDIDLMPNIKKSIDNVDIEFYRVGYKEEMYYKSELLAFIFASIDNDFDIVFGIDMQNCKTHCWLVSENIVYDPSLSIITTKEIYSEKFKQVKELKNEDILDYLEEHNNLYKFYEKGKLKQILKKRYLNFSVDFINNIREEFNKNINKQYVLDNERIKYLKEYFMLYDFIKFRQVLTQKRTYFLKSGNIAVHPSIDVSILDVIEEDTKNISDLMKKEYDKDIDYHFGTIGNCYALSILYNLYNGDFNLVQGRIRYERSSYGMTSKYYYQHSWLEKDDIIYDPALRIVVPKDLYYIFFDREDVYTKKDTENILRRIGFNLTHFRDFMNNTQIGNEETIRYKYLINKIDSPENKEAGEKLISVVRKLKR